jgi:hypothetical protein
VATPDRAARAAAADRFAVALAAVILTAAAAMLVFLAIRFVAAAAHSSYSPWHVLGFPHTHGGRIGVLLVALVVSLLVLAAGLRRRDPLLHFAVEEGAVLIRAGALEDAIRGHVLTDPDVLRVAPRVRQHGELSVEVEVVARPMANRERLLALVVAGTHAALCVGVGLPEVQPHVSLHSVSARRIWRYL